MNVSGDAQGSQKHWVSLDREVHDGLRHLTQRLGTELRSCAATVQLLLTTELCLQTYGSHRF